MFKTENAGKRLPFELASKSNFTDSLAVKHLKIRLKMYPIPKRLLKELCVLVELTMQKLP